MLTVVLLTIFFFFCSFFQFHDNTTVLTLNDCNDTNCRDVHSLQKQLLQVNNKLDCLQIQLEVLKAVQQAVPQELTGKFDPQSIENEFDRWHKCISPVAVILRYFHVGTALIQT